MKYYYNLILAILMLSTRLSHVAFSQQDKPDFLWGVVYSSDEEIQDAKLEIEQLSKRLPQYQTEAKLFKRRKWYVSVVLFLEESDANESKNIIENEYTRGVFVVNLKEWCRPNWSRFTGVLWDIEYYDCKRGEIMEGRTGAIIIKQYRQLEQAQIQIEQLKKQFKKIQHNLAIFYREDFYYTAVINYANQNEANQQRPNNLNVIDAVDIYQWCPHPIPIDNEILDYIECQQQ